MCLHAWSGRMGNLSIHNYGYNTEHDVIAYTVVKDTQSECGQPFVFSKVSIFNLENAGVV